MSFSSLHKHNFHTLDLVLQQLLHTLRFTPDSRLVLRHLPNRFDKRRFPLDKLQLQLLHLHLLLLNTLLQQAYFSLPLVYFVLKCLDFSLVLHCLRICLALLLPQLVDLRLDLFTRLLEVLEIIN